METLIEECAAIRDLLHRYCFCYDDGRYDDWLELFADECPFDFAPYLVTANKAELQQHVENIKAQEAQIVGPPPVVAKHCVFNEMIDVQGDRATAQSYVMVVAKLGAEPPSVQLAGRYEDTLAKVGGTWRFTSRKVHPDMVGPLYDGLAKAGDER